MRLTPGQLRSCSRLPLPLAILVDEQIPHGALQAVARLVRRALQFFAKFELLVHG